MGEREAAELLAALRGYLEELQESGVEELPRGAVKPTATIAAPSASAPAAERPPTVPVPPQGGSTESLDEIRADLGDCHRCVLGDGRTNLVFGVGSPQARVVFVGEAPGRDEDLQGEPFVGEAGQILTRIITRMGLSRATVYICNVLKCRPPGNRNPHVDEIDRCGPFMLRQVQAIKPEVVVALGTFAAQTLLRTKEPISKLRGRFHDYHGIPLMPTFHPSFLLRNRGNSEVYWTVWEDMVQVLKKLGLPVPDVQRKG